MAKKLIVTKRGAEDVAPGAPSRKIAVKQAVKPAVKQAVKPAVVKKAVKRAATDAVKAPSTVTEIGQEITDENVEVIETTTITEPYTSVRVTYNNDTHEYLYEALEPELNAKEKDAIELIKNMLTRTLEYPEEDISWDDKNKFLEDNIRELIRSRKLRLDKSSEDKVVYYVIRDYVGYGLIDVLMNDTMVEDISCDGPNISVFVDHKAYESIKTNVRFPSDEALDSFVITLAQKAGKQISIAEPLIEGTLADGSRLQASLAREVTTRGSSFTLRRFRANPLTPPDIVRYNTLSASMMAYCWLAVEFGESIIASGGTACGKTATVNAISLFIPPQMKIVSIEDTREINLPHENWIAGLTRGGFSGGIGEITMYDLVRAALRQRPQYIIVGEVRGKEAFTLFQAMATGHTTYSTMHADSVQSIVHRLENPPINLPRVLLSALNIVILQSLVTLGDRQVRRINQVVELIGLDSETNDLITNTVYEWAPATDKFKFLGHAVLFDKIMLKKNMTPSEMKDEHARRTDIIKWMLQKNIRFYKDVASAVTRYYKEPETMIEEVRDELLAMGTEVTKIAEGEETAEGE